MRHTAHLIALSASCALAVGSALAQTSPAFGPLPLPAAPAASAPSAATEDMLVADYLGLLRQIAPYAEEGARTYLAIMRLRCGRTLTSAELRRAFAEGDGNPTLMGLIRAAYLKDIAARDQLLAQFSCSRPNAP